MNNLRNGFPAPEDAEVYKTLLESTKAIPWRIDWKTMQFTYIGPQIEKLLGWSQSSWLSVDDWATRMHPDDRDYVVNFCVSQSKGGVDHEADYRALTATGDYIWIRDVVHVVRKNGEVEALVGFMFDISERKRTEEKLIALQKEFEALSYKDGLTGVSNRRSFDSVLDIEWEDARIHEQSLGLIFLDIDFFKQYNDTYGHLQGDDCLKKVASLLREASGREKDFFARFGGEEFVFVLPNTHKAQAIELAEHCRKIIEDAVIEHRASDEGILTISLGVDVIVPGVKGGGAGLVGRVDRLLYRAKQAGRNCVFYAGKNESNG